MPDQPAPGNPPPSGPHQVPAQPPHLPYATPGSSPAGPPLPGGSGAQRVFDTVAGPNLRLADNLIQLACVVVGAAIGGGAGWLLAPPDRRQGIAVAGATGGALVALLLSGLVIGIVRWVGAARQKP